MQSIPALEETEKGLQFSFGNIEEQDSIAKKNSSAVPLNIYPSFQLGNKIVFASHGLEFFNDFSDGETNKKHGIIMHSIFEDIVTADDTPFAVDKAVFEGKVLVSDRNALVSEITEKISHPSISEWFSGTFQVRNENSILMADGKTKRPDRIMTNGNTAIVVDYKFTTEPKASHGAQIKSYISILEEMGYSASGFVWYVSMNIVQPYR